MSINYFRIFTDALIRRADLVKQRDALGIEIGKVTQFLRATYPMLPSAQQTMAAEAMERIEEESPGLKEAVLIILGVANGEWMTPPQIRDRIKEVGIPVDLGVNPLASIGTTLKRLDLETKTLDNGQIAYRKRVANIFGDRAGMRLHERVA